jgi:hypothetical protein
LTSIFCRRQNHCSTMLKFTLTILAVAQVSYGQTTAAYSAASSITSGSGVTSGPVQSTAGPGVTTATSGSCSVQPDSTYLAQLQAQAKANNAVSAVINANPNCKTDNSSGFFLGQICSLGQIIQQLSGPSVSGATCLALNKQQGVIIAAIQQHANDVVPQPLTGENLYQSLLQAEGASFNTLQATANSCKGSSGLGPCLQGIVTLFNNVASITTVIATNDSSSNCNTVSNAVTASLTLIQGSLNGSCSSSVSSGPVTSGPGSTATVSSAPGATTQSSGSGSYYG